MAQISASFRDECYVMYPIVDGTPPSQQPVIEYMNQLQVNDVPPGVLQVIATKQFNAAMLPDIQAISAHWPDKIEYLSPDEYTDQQPDTLSGFKVLIIDATQRADNHISPWIYAYARALQRFVWLITN